MVLVHGVGANDAVPVSVEPLSALAVTLSGSAPGTAVSLHHTEVASRLAGVIDSIAVEVGDRVATGDVLAELDCTEYARELARHEAQLEALEARRTLADAQLQRALKLLPTRNIPEEQVNQRRAEFDVASAEIVAQKAQVAISRRQVEHCRIVSPFDGVVTRRTASLGAYVSPGTAVAEVIDTERVEVSSQVPLGDVGQLATRPLSFRTDNGEYEVALRTLVPLIDASSRSQEARLRFAGEPAVPGTPGRVVWVADDSAVPAHLLVAHDGALGVYVADDGVARFVPLPGAVEGRAAAANLDPDTLVITLGRHAVAPGRPIVVETD